VSLPLCANASNLEIPPIRGWYTGNIFEGWKHEISIEVFPKGVDCVWGEWKSGECSKEGERELTREVQNPEFLFGEKCQGPDNKTEKCEMPKDSEQHLADSTGCPKDWFPFGNSCFSPSLPDLTWTEASDACKMKGGDLASVHSEEEIIFISRLLPNRTCWIGANNVNFEEEWSWSDGSPWRNHSKAQRMSSERGMGAVGIDFQGNWHLLSTSSKEKHCSVCKVQAQEQQQDKNKGHVAHSAWDFFWAIPVLFVLCLAVGGALYAKKAQQKRTGQMKLSRVSTTTSCLVED